MSSLATPLPTIQYRHKYKYEYEYKYRDRYRDRYKYRKAGATRQSRGGSGGLGRGRGERRLTSGAADRVQRLLAAGGPNEGVAALQRGDTQVDKGESL